MQQNKSADMDAAMAKLYPSESFVKSCRDAVQMHGGTGFLTELEFDLLMLVAPVLRKLAYPGDTESTLAS